MIHSFAEKASKWFRERFKIPFGVKVAVCVLPAFFTALFYLLRSVREVMDWVAVYFSRPVRGFFTMIYSLYPLAVMEILCSAAGVLLIYYIIKTIIDCRHRREKWKLLGRRALWLLVASLYIFSAWCWLWSSGYHATRFTEKNGLVNDGISTQELILVTEYFANKVNELSGELDRDEDGNLILNRRDMFADSKHIYENISQVFPSLHGYIYAPKPMYLYSWFMSITGYSGMYFALTGEAMVNIQQHAAFMPVTVSHEIAHQLGIYAEDEASLVGILACVTSENPVFEYAGFMSGYNYLSNALASADFDEYNRISSGLNRYVRLDRTQNFDFWADAKKSNLGIDWLDNILSKLKRTSSSVVDSVYDDYLKSNNQQLGLMSYGACVDLLVEYFISFTNEIEW